MSLLLTASTEPGEAICEGNGNGNESAAIIMRETSAVLSLGIKAFKAFP
jgi:hypothetical protein